MASKDKLYAIKVKENGTNTYSEEIPIHTLADNVEWNNNDFNLSIKEILGNVETTGMKDANDNINDEMTIQGQINLLKNNKLDQQALNSYVNKELRKKANEWLDQELEPGTILKTDNLVSNDNQSAQSSEHQAIVNNQFYPVVKDNMGKLSVSVPWIDTDTLPDFQNVWSGTCSTEANTAIKQVILDHPDNFDETKEGTVIAVYFEKGNTAQSPKLKINRKESFIYYAGKDAIQKMDGTIDAAWYTFTPGLKFFVNYKVGDQLVWLLTTIDYSLISYINSQSATLDSPELKGTPTLQNTPDTSDNSKKIANTEFVNAAIDNKALKISDLQSGSEQNVSTQSLPSYLSEDRQYPVIKDREGKLSVNVPWENNFETNHIWVGTCTTEAENNAKVIDLPSDISITNGTILIVYFSYGNTAISQPGLIINDNIYDILYPTSATEVNFVMEDTPSVIRNWGIGLKIFVYDESNNGWIIQPDMFSIFSLMNNKADINSPDFKGFPTAPTPENWDTPKQIATTGFVKNAIDQTLEAGNQNTAKEFDSTETYSIGDYVYYDGLLYQFITSHVPGEWSSQQVYQVSITDKLKKVEQTLDSILVDGTESITCTNEGQLQNFISSGGFTKVQNDSNLVAFNCNLRNNSTGTILNRLNKPIGNWLIGYSYRIRQLGYVSSNDFTLKIFNGSGATSSVYTAFSSSWRAHSFYTSNTGLSDIVFTLTAKDNVSYDKDATVRIEIRNFYIYNLDEQVDNRFRNYIIQEQQRDYKSGTVTYYAPNPYLDTTLSQEGKAPESKTVGDAIQTVLGNFATVESSSTASKAYAVGENLVYDNVMYKVTTAIARGDTITPITPGKNVNKTTVAAACDEAVRKAEEAVSTAETGVLNITADSTYGFEGRLRKIGKVATLVLGCSGSSAVFPEPHTGLFLPLEIGTFPPGFEPVAGDMGAPVKITYYGSGTPTTAWGSVFYNEFVSGDGNKLFIEEGSSSNRFSFESVVITYLTA